MGTFGPRPARRFLTIAAICSLVTGSVAASPSPASASGHDEASIELGFAEATGVEHLRANDRIIVTGDDDIEILSDQQAVLHEIGGVRGATMPTENKNHDGDFGHLVVVYAADTNELVVLDSSNGSITRRINPGAARVSSVVFIDDTIWYAHGPDQHDAGIGIASATTGAATAFVWEDSIYAGSEIDVSPSNTDQVFLSRSALSPSRLARYDTGATAAVHFPYHESFDPFAVLDDGTAIWSENNGALTEVRTSDMTRSGRTIARDAYHVRQLLIVDDTNLIVANRDQVETYAIANGTHLGTATFFGDVIDIDATTSELFTVTAPNRLVISGFAHVPVAAEPEVEPIGTACSAVTDSINRLYSAYFLRAPEQDGWAYWVNAYAGGGHNMDSMSTFFAQSPEFKQLYGSLSDADFVDLVYSNVLGRQPDAEGRQYWIGQLSSGATSRGRLMINFSESEEYVQLTDTAVPLAGYFNWYPLGTTFHCAAGQHLFELGEGDKYVDFYAVNPNATSRRYEIVSRFGGEWFDDVSTTLAPGGFEAFQGSVVNIDGMNVLAPSDVTWVFVRSPSPLPEQRAGWPFFALRAGGSSERTAPFGATALGF